MCCGKRGREVVMVRKNLTGLGPSAKSEINIIIIIIIINIIVIIIIIIII